LGPPPKKSENKLNKPLTFASKSGYDQIRE